MRIRPLGDRVVLKRVEEETKTPGGILIPSNAREKPIEGEVLAIGPGRVNEKGVRVEMTVRVGDRVLFGKFSGTEVKVAGEDYLLVKEEEILGILSPVPAE